MNNVIEKKLYSIIKKHMPDIDHTINKEDSFRNDLLIDSLSFISLITDIENKFKIEIKEEYLIIYENNDIKVKDLTKIIENILFKNNERK